MKKLMIAAAALMVACAAYGQGQFVFNSKDAASGNDVKFFLGANPASGSDLFVQVFAGLTADQAAMQPVTGTTVAGPLPLNRTGTVAGYPNPAKDIYTVTGQGAGKNVFVGWQAFQGTSLATATAKSPFMISATTVALTEPPAVPNTAVLGAQTVTIVPEPGTLALGLLGLGTLLAIRRRQ